MKPSFHTLFRRRERETQSPQEVFAVAAVAFCLKHDAEFRVKFLRDFCGLSLENGIKSFPVDVAADDHKWGDLVVASHDTSFVCVLEFKIGAEVTNRQNPNSKEEFDYAKAICENYRDCKDRRFILVTDEDKKETIGCQQQHDVDCFWKSWDDLSHIQGVSPLTLDLFDCFAAFNIQAFTERRLRSKNMHVANSAFGAKSVIQVLSLIFKQLKLGQLKIQNIDEKYDNDESWHTGVYISKEQSEAFEGWFGFDGQHVAGNTKPGTSRATVWFYCHDSQEKEDCLRKLLSSAGFKPEKEPGWDSATVCNLVVRNDRGSDYNWFESVYKTVGANK